MSRHAIDIALGYIAYQCFLNAPIQLYEFEARSLTDQIARVNKAEKKHRYASPIYFRGRDYQLHEARNMLEEREARLKTMKMFSPVHWLIAAME
jgi:hypothetical protein